MCLKVDARVFGMTLRMVADREFKSSHPQFAELRRLLDEFLKESEKEIRDFEIPELKNPGCFHNTFEAIGSQMETAFLKNMQVSLFYFK
jgi:hypothetical protein